MIITSTIRTIALASIVAAGSLALFAQAVSAAPDDPAAGELVATQSSEGFGLNNMKQIVVAAHNDGTGAEAPHSDLLLHRWQTSGSTNSVDFYIWQRSPENAGDLDCSELVQWASSAGVNPAAAHEVGHLLGLGNTH